MRDSKIGSKKFFSLWGDRLYSPLVMYCGTDAMVNGLKKIYKKSAITEAGCYWNKMVMKGWLFIKDELDITVENLSHDALKSPKLMLNIFKTAVSNAKTMRLYTEKILQSDLKKIPTKQLVSHIVKASDLFVKLYSYGSVPNLLGYAQDGFMYKKMNDILINKLQNNSHNFADCLQILTRPPENLVTDLFKLDILKVAKNAKKKKINSKKNIKSIFEKELSDIENKYGWLSFDLLDSLTWDKGYYVNLIHEEMKKNISDEIKKINLYKARTIREVNNIRKGLGLNKTDIEIINLVRDVGYYKWLREYEFMKALYNLKFIQDEFGKRIGLTTLQVKYLLPSEYDTASLNPKMAKKLTRERQKEFMFMLKFPGRSKLFNGENARKMYKGLIFWKEDNINQDKELKGMPAMSGYVKGVVKIILSPKDAGKISRGNILVAQATSPDLVPAMKLAGAIVTDEGGIASHAAIVSRELGVPCVVGTKTATKNFKDGDLVEVDANKGIVKISKRNE